MRVLPLLVRSLLRPLPVQLRQIRPCRRFNTRLLGQPSQEVVVGFSVVPPHDRPHRRVRLQRRGIHADRLPVDQTGRLQHPQHPGEHFRVCFQIDQPPGPRHRRIVRHRPGQSCSQKLPQTQRVGASPGNPTFRIEAFEVAHQLHPEVHSRRHSGPAHHRCIELLAGVLDEPVEPVLFQNPVHPFIKNMAARPWQFLRRNPERILSTLSPSQCHIAFSSTHSLRDMDAGGPFDIMKNQTLTSGC